MQYKVEANREGKTTDLMDTKGDESLGRVLDERMSDYPLDRTGTCPVSYTVGLDLGRRSDGTLGRNSGPSTTGSKPRPTTTRVVFSRVTRVRLRLPNLSPFMPSLV